MAPDPVTEMAPVMADDVVMPVGDVEYRVVDLDSYAPGAVTDTPAVDPMVNKPVYDISAQGRTIIPAPTYDDDYYDDANYTDMAF